MDCPRCDAREISGPECPRCGVILAKIRAAPGTARSTPPRTAPPRASTVHVWIATLFGLIIGAFAFVWLFTRASMTPKSDARRAVAATQTPVTADSPLPTAPPLAGPPPPRLALPATTQGFTPEDVAEATRLMNKIKGREPIGPPDIASADALFTRYGSDTNIAALHGGVLCAAAGQFVPLRRFPEAIDLLRRAANTHKDNLAARLMLIDVFTRTEDWPGLEAIAREAVALDPNRFEAWRGLGHALMRQDRNREAEEALVKALSLQSDEFTALLLARVRKALLDESGMRDHRLSHFNLRYDGDAHDDVGREILRALERHYATLATTFDHTPATSIPVILFTSQRYHDASGAPAWAGGSYDSLDGRIRIPIAGLTRDLTPDINDVLLHELTHVFVWEMSGGIAPRQVQEGLAQYTEGKRVESQLTPEQVTALADGRVRGVSGFYIASLSFVEYLVAQRGQSGINDLLKAMRERGNADQAFNDVYGQSLSGLMEAWSNRMRLRHGS